MKKKIFLSLAIVVALAVGVVGMSAFEAHVVNVTATIENATDISTTAFTYGTTFPQEILHNPVTLSLSASFANSGAVGVDYKIKQKPKCQLIATSAVLPQFAQVTESADHIFVCPDGYAPMPILCPFLSKTSPTKGDISIPSFHGPTSTAAWTDTVSEANAAVGHLTNGNPATTWDIDMHVPCFAGQCGQDWAAYVHTANPDAVPNAYMISPNLQGQLLGCDLWYEVTGVNRNPT